MDFLYKKHPKGTYEYVSYRRVVDLIVTLIMFALALGLYIIGRVTTGSPKNLLTIVAVLGLLPACRMVVNMVMCFRVKICDPSLKDEIDGKTGQDLYGMYNIYFTSYDKNYMITHLVISKDSVIGLSLDPKFDEKAFNDHIRDMSAKEGIKDVFVKIFTDSSKYLTRLDELLRSSSAEEPNMALVRLIHNISL